MDGIESEMETSISFADSMQKSPTSLQLIGRFIMMYDQYYKNVNHLLPYVIEIANNNGSYLQIKPLKDFMNKMRSPLILFNKFIDPKR